MTELDVIGREALSFTVSGEWAHFRRIDTTTDKQTYRIIPRTTVTGLVAAILGRPRDSYYDLFQPENSEIGIEPQFEVRTMQVPMLTLPTSEGDIQTAEGVSGKALVPPERTGEERKRRTFEYLRRPRYRIHLVLADGTVTEELAERLDVDASPGETVVTPYYTPYLGKSECLATIGNTARNVVTEAKDVDRLDSVVPESALTPRAEVSYGFERSPGYMTTDKGGRKTTAFISYGFRPDGDPIAADGVDTTRIGDSRVCLL